MIQINESFNKRKRLSGAFDPSTFVVPTSGKQRVSLSKCEKGILLMSSTLVDGLTDVFRSQALGSFATRSGESESSVLKGFQASMGTMVAGLSSKLGQTGFVREVMDLINSPANDTRVLEHVGSLVEQKKSDGLGSRFTSLLFGSNMSAITDTIGSASGLRGGTVASLMSVGAPLLLGSLGQRARQSSMDPSRLTSYLSDEAAGVWGSLPKDIPRLIGSEVAGVPPVASGMIRERSRTPLWPLLLAALLILGLVWYFSSRRVSVEPVKSAANAVANVVERTLPGNILLRIPAGQMEDHLLTFLQDPTKFPNESTYFDFDRLLFDTDSATLQPASEAQLHDIATVLRAYPSVRVKIGGYTDNVGDSASNQLLSEQRANNVKNDLITMGISADRLEAQGYGEQFPVADNSTDEGRQKNRRISLLVTQK